MPAKRAKPKPKPKPPPPPPPGPDVDPTLLPAPLSEAPPATRDRLTPEARSRNMAQIRSRNTKPELLVRQLVTSLGLRYRLQRRDLPGKPDLVFGPRRTVLFVHGCFWHQHAHCPAGRIPTANRDFWLAKLNRNTERDAQTTAALRRLGWRVLTVWECETRHPDKLLNRLARLLLPPP